MKKLLIGLVSVLTFSAYANAGSASCNILTAGEDQKLECAQAKIEKKIAKLSKLLSSLERKIEEERIEQINEGDETKAQGLALLEKLAEKLQEELHEAMIKLDELVQKHHELDEKTDTRD